MIELMLVIVIIAILAVVAIPIYGNYASRARIEEGLNLASSPKFAVSEYALANKSLPPDQHATAYVSPQPTPNVQSITIADDGTAAVVITYTEAAGGGTIALTPNIEASGEISWRCSGTLPDQYLPTNCR
ncbi:type IV pilus assembly protein PilA (plasmid) [Legionella adelaidensis]|uniref:Type IV pilus assembly protein PilA n=2 Tax=Legionella adelaidensis TaxID=45056 RepID=A0A0W0R345_9GAMM|nr:type IV pilus assembly protein PilA [Legionella adelaidensis]VEH84704.1 type IV pilus assembly protein PilA [Legionella adelaidensis]